ncbi:UNVERIFIED_CONTAM: hypothetical protein Cloal_2832 [Acetivibrio alkalicellulosi]
MHYFFVDAETDGLYGEAIAIAAIVVNQEGVEVDVFCGKIQGLTHETIKDEWTKENVLPLLGDDLTEFENGEMLLEAFWHFWIKYQQDALCIADVQYPVEAGIFRKCVEKSTKERIFLGPFPLLDLSTLLYVKGIDPLADRQILSGLKDTRRHHPLDDVRISAEIWRKYNG